MGKRDELIAKYADDLKNKCKVNPDMDLLTKVTIGCGPSIYDNDAQTVAASDKEELERIKNNFLIKKLEASEEYSALTVQASLTCHSTPAKGATGPRNH